MMDFSLDPKQSRVLQCSSCDPAKMKLRNCNGQFGKSQSPILVNGNIYRQCPRSLVVDSWELGYLVSLYFDCRENKVHPHGNSLLQQTAFCKDAFDFMDFIVSEHREREDQKLRDKMERESKKSKMKSVAKRPTKRGR